LRNPDCGLDNQDMLLLLFASSIRIPQSPIRNHLVTRHV